MDLLNQVRHRGLLVHALIGQGPEPGAQRGHHPATQVDVAAGGIPLATLDRHHHLLGDKTVPTTQRLGIPAAVGVVGGHVRAHDVSGVAGDIKTGPETVLQTHARHMFSVYAGPGGLVGLDQLAGRFDFLPIRAHGISPETGNGDSVESL